MRLMESVISFPPSARAELRKPCRASRALCTADFDPHIRIRVRGFYRACAQDLRHVRVGVSKNADPQTSLGLPTMGPNFAAHIEGVRKGKRWEPAYCLQRFILPGGPVLMSQYVNRCLLCWQRKPQHLRKPGCRGSDFPGWQRGQSGSGVHVGHAGYA